VCTLARDCSSPPALRSRSSRLRATSSSRASSFPCELIRAQCRDRGGVFFLFPGRAYKTRQSFKFGSAFLVYIDKQILATSDIFTEC
jgi:hypothetical protein